MEQVSKAEYDAVVSMLEKSVESAKQWKDKADDREGDIALLIAFFKDLIHAFKLGEIMGGEGKINAGKLIGVLMKIISSRGKDIGELQKYFPDQANMIMEKYNYLIQADKTTSKP